MIIVDVLFCCRMSHRAGYSVDERVFDVMSLASSLYHCGVNIALSNRQTLQWVLGSAEVLRRQLRVYDEVVPGLGWSNVVEIRGARAERWTSGVRPCVVVVMMVRLYVLTECRTRRHARLSTHRPTINNIIVIVIIGVRIHSTSSLIANICVPSFIGGWDYACRLLWELTASPNPRTIFWENGKGNREQRRRIRGRREEQKEREGKWR